MGSCRFFTTSSRIWATLYPSCRCSRRTETPPLFSKLPCSTRSSSKNARNRIPYTIQPAQVRQRTCMALAVQKILRKGLCRTSSERGAALAILPTVEDYILHDLTYIYTMLPQLRWGFGINGHAGSISPTVSRWVNVRLATRPVARGLGLFVLLISRCKSTTLQQQTSNSRERLGVPTVPKWGMCRILLEWNLSSSS